MQRIRRIATPLAITLLASFALAGCSMLPTTKKNKSAAHAVENIATQQTISVEKMVDISPGASIVRQEETSFSPTNHAAAYPGQTVPANYRATVKLSATTGQATKSDSVENIITSSTLPMGVKLALLAVGVAMCVGAGWLLKHASPTAKAAIDAAETAGAAAVRTAQAAASEAIKRADNSLRNRIAALRDRAMHSTDQNEIVKHTTEIANLEAERGRLNSQQ